MKKVLMASVAIVVLAAGNAHAGRFGSGGVSEAYDGGYAASGGQTIYRIKCNNGGSGSAFQKSDGYWYDGSGNNYGDSFRGLSLNGFASKACQ